MRPLGEAHQKVSEVDPVFAPIRRLDHHLTDPAAIHDAYNLERYGVGRARVPRTWIAGPLRPHQPSRSIPHLPETPPPYADETV